MKKRISVLLALLLVFTMFLSACGKKADDADKGKDDAGKTEADENKEEEKEENNNADVEYDFEVTFEPMNNVDVNIALTSQDAEEKIPAGSYMAVSGGIYAVDEDAIISLPLCRVAGSGYPGLTYIPGKDPASWAGHALTNHVELDEGFKLTVDGVFAGNGITFKVNKLELIYEEGKWIKASMAGDNVTCDLVIDYSVYDVVDKNVALTSTVAETAIPTQGKYNAIKGGIYVNDEKTPIDLPISRVTGSGVPGLTYIPGTAPENWGGYALDKIVPVEEGLKLRVNGIYAGNGVEFQIKDLVLVYTGGKWVKQ